MFSLSKRGASDGMVSFFIGIMIVTIIAVSVTLPIVIDTVNNSSATGTTATIIALLPLFVAVILLVVYAAAIQ